MSTIIRYFQDKINSFSRTLSRPDVVMVIVAIGLSLTGFSLGYHAGTHKVVPVVTVQNNACIAPITESTQKNAEILAQGTSTIVASKSGARYYFVWCSGATRIALKNRVYFQTVEEAEKKGYTKASGCN